MAHSDFPSRGSKRKVAVSFLGIDPSLKLPDDDPAWLANLVRRLAPLTRITSRQLERGDETLRITYGLSAGITTESGTDAAFSGFLTVILGVENGSPNTGGSKSWKKQRREQITGRA